MQEIEALRQELGDTRKKLQEYADTIVSLYGELRILREGICNGCKKKQNATVVHFSPVVNRHPPGEGSNLWRRMLKGKRRHESPILSFPSTTSSFNSPTDKSLSPCCPKLPVISTPFIMDMLPTSSCKAIALKTETNVPQWYVKRDQTANAAVDFTFERTVLLRDRVQSVRFSPDGKYLAAAIWGGAEERYGATVIYDAQKGNKHCVLMEYSSQYLSEARPGIWCMCFSPNGRYLAVGDTTTYRIIVWDIPRKRIRNIFVGHDNIVRSVDFSPNGRLVASASWDMTVRIWDIRDGSAKVFTGSPFSVWSVRFSPNGQHVAAGNFFGGLWIWNVRTGRMIQNWNAHEHYISDVVFMPDGKGLLSCGDGKVTHWDVSSLGMVESNGNTMPKKILEYEDHTMANCFAISSDARWIASASKDNTVVVWDARSAMRQCALLGHEDIVLSVDFSPSGKSFATGSWDHYVSLWRYTGTD